jgi:hypothetical protein
MTSRRYAKSDMKAEFSSALDLCIFAKHGIPARLESVPTTTFESDSAIIPFFEHGLLGKALLPFPDHALIGKRFLEYR